MTVRKFANLKICKEISAIINLQFFIAQSLYMIERKIIATIDINSEIRVTAENVSHVLSTIFRMLHLSRIYKRNDE